MTRRPGLPAAAAAGALAIAGRVTVAVVAAVAAAVMVAALSAITVAVAPPAHAATAYRYWAYYVAAGDAWNYSQRGPAFEHPVDGEVQGWRFAVQSPGSQDLLPRYRPDFATLCATTPALAGQLRAGVVIDFGVAADAPPGQQPPSGVFTGCVRVPDGSTGMDVLNAAVGAANVRIGTAQYAGLVCGISGYPKAECAAAATPATAVKTAPAPATPAPATPTRGASAPATSATSGPAQRAATTVGATPASAPSLSSAAPAPAAASATATTSGLADLRRHHGGGGFPIGSVIGGGLVVLLGAGAAWRIWAARR